MESIGLYLLKSVIWLTGFSLVFLIVLRNERYFRLNRIYLLSGIIASIVFPFLTWHYTIVIPAVQDAYITTSGITEVVRTPPPTVIPVYFWFYVVGIAGLALRMIWQTGKVVRKLRKAGFVKTGSIKLVRTAEYDASFSFFSFVFVNPSINDIETEEIVNHEREHIEQRHWFDLLLIELLCMLQWFNPFVWIYARLIRQNHEYLADEMALQHTSNPAIYQAALLNQLFGAPVISLANSFNYSLNKKRFKMMKKKIDSPFRKLRMLLVLPLVAMVFYAFGEPEYISNVSASSTDNKLITVVEAMKELNAPLNLPADKKDTVKQAGKIRVVKGKVVNQEGKPLGGTTVIISGSNTGVITDKEGNFKIKNIPKGGELVFSFAGHQTITVKPDAENAMLVKMDEAAVEADKQVVFGSLITKHITFSSKFTDKQPLYILNGDVIEKTKMDALNPEDISNIEVLKDQSATGLYGDNAKYGVIRITTKNNFTNDPLKEPLFVLDGEFITKARLDALGSDKIKSINVLKDASAIAKYGNKGSNGVIEITTKNKAGIDSNIDVNSVHLVVEEMPEFPGGKGALMNFITANIKYPTQASADKVEGRVFVNFVVSPTGKVTNAKIVKGFGNHELNDEAIRVVSKMPDWKPGKEKGVAVNVSYTIPIEFKL
jgi:TonB family protein